jgi:hypothetical protein
MVWMLKDALAKRDYETMTKLCDMLVARANQMQKEQRDGEGQEPRV